MNRYQSKKEARFEGMDELPVISDSTTFTLEMTIKSMTILDSDSSTSVYKLSYAGFPHNSQLSFAP